MNAMREVTLDPLTAGMPMGFTLLRVPFFLEPDYPTSEEFEETNRTRLIRKWGGVHEFAAQKSRHQLKERGREVSIEHFNLDRVASSTMLSHRLVQWVTKTKGINKAEQLYNILNERHFVIGQKLNSQDMLCEAAEEIGLEKAAVMRFLDSDEGYEEIARAQEMLRAARVHSIPTFILGGQSVSGAMHSTEFVKIFRQFERNGGDEALGASVFAEALGIPAPMMAETLEITG